MAALTPDNRGADVRMKRASLPITITAGLMMAGVALHARSAGTPGVSYDGLVLKSDAGADRLSVQAQFPTRWGKAEAQLTAARNGDGGLVDSARAWWQSDLPELDSAVRVGSQQAVASFLRSAVDLTGLGLTGRLAPAVLDYALAVGRLEQQAGGLPAAAAWLQRKLGPQGALALHALQVGQSFEVGAALDTLGALPGIGRWGLVQNTQPGATKTRLVSDQRLVVRGATVQARADRVVSGCTSPSGAGLALQSAADGCLTLSAEGAFDVKPNWQMTLGSSYKLRADDSVARQAFVGTIWQARPGLRLSLTLQQRAPTQGGQALGASLSYPLNRAF